MNEFEKQIRDLDKQKDLKTKLTKLDSIEKKNKRLL